MSRLGVAWQPWKEEVVVGVPGGQISVNALCLESQI